MEDIIAMGELDYDLVWAIESISQLVDGIVVANPTYRNNKYLNQLGIDFDKLYSKYYDTLYNLCEIAIKQGNVDAIRAELSEDDRYNFDELIKEIEYLSKEIEHEDLIYSVEVGDKVKLYNGNVRYVADIDDNTLWVTPSRDTDRGWSAQLSDVVEILEKYNEE